MAIPIYQEQLHEAALPGPRYQGHSAETFGASIGASLSRFGVALQAKAEEFEDAQTMEMIGNYRREIEEYHLDPDNGVFNTRRGKNAYGMADESLAFMQNKRDEYISRISSDRMRRNFERMSNNYIDNRHSTNMRFETQNIDAYEIQEWTSGIDNYLREAMASPEDVATWDYNMQEIESLMVMIADKNGIGEEDLGKKITEFKSKANLQRLQILLASNPRAALELYGLDVGQVNIPKANVSTGKGNYVGDYTVNSTEKRISQWNESILKYSEQLGVDPNLSRAVMWVESRGNKDSVSSAGAIGLMQLMPSTAKGLGVDPHDPDRNILGGIKYIRQMLDKFGGDVNKALAAYNGGPGIVKKDGTFPNTGYVRQVLNKYKEYTEHGGGYVTVSAPNESQGEVADELMVASGREGTLRDTMTPQDQAIMDDLCENFIAQDVVDQILKDPNYRGDYGSVDVHDLLKGVTDPTLRDKIEKRFQVDWSNIQNREKIQEEKLREAQFNTYAKLFERMLTDPDNPLTLDELNEREALGEISAWHKVNLIQSMQQSARRASAGSMAKELAMANGINPELWTKDQEYYYNTVAALGGNFELADQMLDYGYKLFYGKALSGNMTDLDIQDWSSRGFLLPSTQDLFKRGQRINNDMIEGSQNFLLNTFKDAYSPDSEDSLYTNDGNYQAYMGDGKYDSMYDKLKKDLEAVAIRYKDDPNAAVKRMGDVYYSAVDSLNAELRRNGFGDINGTVPIPTMSSPSGLSIYGAPQIMKNMPTYMRDKLPDGMMFTPLAQRSEMIKAKVDEMLYYADKNRQMNIMTNIANPFAPPPSVTSENFGKSVIKGFDSNTMLTERNSVFKVGEGHDVLVPAFVQNGKVHEINPNEIVIRFDSDLDGKSVMELRIGGLKTLNAYKGSDAIASRVIGLSGKEVSFDLFRVGVFDDMQKNLPFPERQGWNVCDFATRWQNQIYAKNAAANAPGSVNEIQNALTLLFREGGM